jgi:hypothetical protein
MNTENQARRPYNITNEWWNGWDWWWDWTNGLGNSVSFSFTNATAGWVGFGNLSAMMRTNAPGCGVWVHWADNASSGRSYAFVAVDSLTPDMGVLIATNPDTYIICSVPTNSPITNLTITASPNPGMLDKFLPAGWQMTGGIPATNSDSNDVPISRTRRLVDLTTPSITTVTCVSGCSSKTVKIVVAKVEVKAKSYPHTICNPPIISAYYFDNPSNGCADNLLGLWQEDAMKLNIFIRAYGLTARKSMWHLPIALKCCACRLTPIGLICFWKDCQPTNLPFMRFQPD